MSALRRIVAVARKEFIHISRDWRILVSVLLMPVIQLLLFSYAICFDVKNVPTVVMDQDRTAQSRDLLSQFGQSGFFRVVAYANNDAEIDSFIARSAARVAIVIPPGFGRDVTAARTPTVQVLVDGSEPNSAQLAQAYATALTQSVSRGISVTWAQQRGLDPASVGQLSPRVANVVQPGTPQRRLPHPGVDGRDHHDRHRAADRRLAGP